MVRILLAKERLAETLKDIPNERSDELRKKIRSLDYALKSINDLSAKYWSIEVDEYE
jgi:hypothetical protein